MSRSIQVRCSDVKASYRSAMAKIKEDAIVRGMTMLSQDLQGFHAQSTDSGCMYAEVWANPEGGVYGPTIGWVWRGSGLVHEKIFLPKQA